MMVLFDKLREPAPLAPLVALGRDLENSYSHYFTQYGIESVHFLNPFHYMLQSHLLHINRLLFLDDYLLVLSWVMSHTSVALNIS